MQSRKATQREWLAHFPRHGIERQYLERADTLATKDTLPAVRRRYWAPALKQLHLPRSRSAWNSAVAPNRARKRSASSDSEFSLSRALPPPRSARPEAGRSGLRRACASRIRLVELAAPIWRISDSTFSARSGRLAQPFVEQVLDLERQAQQVKPARVAPAWSRLEDRFHLVVVEARDDRRGHHAGRDAGGASARIASSRRCGAEARGSMSRASSLSSVVTDRTTSARLRLAMSARMSMSRVTSGSW